MPLIPLAGTRTNIEAITATDLIDNELVLDTDSKELYTFDDANDRLLSVGNYVYLFGHSGTLSATNALRAIGLTSTANSSGYVLHDDMVFVEFSLRRGDTDSSAIEVMTQSTTVEYTGPAGTTQNQSVSGLDVELDAGDLLWARVASGAANDMDPLCLALTLKKRIAL